ncbi:MAG: urate hydroxylase PuuD [Candidatus Phaeomarinobacter sp.]
MAGILSNLRNTVITGFVLALVLCIFYIYGQYSSAEHFAEAFGSQPFWAFVLRWAHVLCGIMWSGLLYYFNFVQIPNMPNIPDDQKPAIGKVIAPAALWWFRWGAMGTIGFGIVLAALNGYLIEAYLLGLTDGGASTIIGIGMWLGTIMWFNVWFVIWPNQKIALGIVDAPAEDKPKAARTAMLFSRTNTMLSVPMLFAMVSNQNAF